MAFRRYCRCGNPLARDHAEQFCATCQRERRRDRAPQVSPEFWQDATMDDALTSGDLGRIIRAYRAHPFWGHPLPQTTVADWLHVGQSTLSRIEQGKRRLSVEEMAGFASALGLSIAIRWEPQYTGEHVDPLSRRSLFGVGIGAALGLNATTAPTAAREIDPELVSHWMKLLRVLGRHDAMFGSHDVLATVRHELGLIADHRQSARGALCTQLLHVEARWAEFAAWLSDDAGDSRMCDYWTARAMRLAHESGYQDMVAWVLMSESREAAAQEDARRAVALADAALRTPGTSDQSRALATLRVAHGHAVGGDAASFERAFADAEMLLDALPVTPREDLGAEYVTHAYVAADEARCWIRLRPRKAITLLEEALRLWPRDRARGRGLHQARLALACAAADEPERGAAEGIKALDIAQATKSDLTARELGRLDRQLAACDSPAATGFREAFATT
jgi:transcriptional regulator with XRE-family HTH domain